MNAAQCRHAGRSPRGPARVAAGQFLQKFTDDRALTLASLVAWGMLNTFLPLLLGVLSLIGLLVGDSPAAAAAEATVLAPLPAEASQLVQDSLASVGRVAGAGLPGQSRSAAVQRLELLRPPGVGVRPRRPRARSAI